jgi:photosystem II stability/assembly factor-like uncharacterized protein
VGKKSTAPPKKPYIINTTNEGLSWNRQDNINISSNWNDFILYSCFFTDKNNGWSVGANGVLLKTTNAGESWNIAWGNLDPNNFWVYTYLYDVCFVDQNTGFITGTIERGITNASLFLKTTNGGITWDTSDVSFPYQNKIYFKDKLRGYLFGWDSFATTDGGNVWQRISPKAISGFAADGNFLWATGTGGSLYRNMVTPGSAEDYGSVVQSFSLYQNYPNPFNPVTVINFDLRSSGRVTIKIYDVLGREIKTLVDEERSAGKYKIFFDGRGLASGVYYYTLTAGNKRETKKMMLVK